MQELAEWLWSAPSRPSLLEVEIEMSTNAYPKIAFGQPITEMEPLGKTIPSEKTLKGSLPWSHSDAVPR